MIRLALRLALLAVVLLVGVAVVFRLIGQTEKTAELRFPGVRDLRVDTTAGITTITAAAGPARVRRTARYVAFSPDVREDENGGVLTIAADCPGFGVLTNCSVDYAIRVPAATAVVVESDVGGVRLAGLAGDIEAGITVGSIELRDVRSRRITTRTGAGDITVTMPVAPPSLRLALNARQGDLRVVVPRGRYRIDADTDLGDIDLGSGITNDARAPRSIVMRTNAGDVSVRAR